ncbi:hypothetical protein BN1708_004085 [Verticillium longisporum]|uniref:Calcofluor white hypersensitive protein n=1 Tax=Verticillium longisporum TaxID=100787 RepID=A0A0G4LVC1_VERLO|nr:hypothetical protein BN1708_004085 [Verticillium longisporum]
MSSRYKDKDGGVVLAFSGQWVSWLHTTVAYTAFISAFIVGVSLHYKKIVQNEWYGYPEEWFPSVSATIGDKYPERSFFMLFIAITSGPRFALVGLWYLLTRKPGQTLPKFIFTMGIFRTLTCGGFTYVTSTDDHQRHDIFMISYIVATLPWTIGCVALSPPNPKAIRYRKIIASSFFGTLVPLIYFFIQHKVHRVPGAYTTYAFFEWSLILFDVAFDAVTAYDFRTFQVIIKDVQGASKGENRSSVPSAVLEKEKEKASAGILSVKFTWTEAIDTVAEVYHGYIFWTILTSLGVSVWYFPLWYMGLSGYEVVVMASVSPLLLSIGPLRRMVVANQRIVHLLSLSAIVAYKVESPVYRLFAVSFGVSMACLSWATTFYAESIHEGRLESKLLALTLGLVLSSAIKFAWWTNNPVWPIMHAANGGWNGIGGILATLAALRFTRKAPLTSGQSASDPQRSGAAKRNPVITFGLGFLFYNFLVLFSVWVVAYAFVPGGPYVREHTDWVMATMMLLIGLGVLGLGSTTAQSRRKKAQRPSASVFRHRKFHSAAAIAVNLFFLSAAFLRFPTNDYKPYHGEDRVMTAGVWTIHFALDNDMWSSEYRMRDLIKEMELDVVALIETDCQRIIMGNRDTSQFLAEDLGMYVDYGPGPNKHTWGVVLLSKYPILKSEHHLLPSPVGELAPAIHATLDVYGREVDVFVFHSGQEEDLEDRRLQSLYLSKLMGSTPRPAILLSYLVTKPLQGNYNTYVSDVSGMHDVDPSDWDRWCEYILFKRLKRVAYARVSRSTITDTELQAAKFVIPATEAESNAIEALDDETRNRRVNEEDVPVGWRFPALFRGKGVRDHRYHVFDEPRYYNN